MRLLGSYVSFFGFQLGILSLFFYFDFSVNYKKFILQVSLPANDQSSAVRHPALRRLVLEGRHGSVVKGMYLELNEPRCE